MGGREIPNSSVSAKGAFICVADAILRRGFHVHAWLMNLCILKSWRIFGCHLHPYAVTFHDRSL